MSKAIKLSNADKTFHFYRDLAKVATSSRKNDFCSSDDYNYKLLRRKLSVSKKLLSEHQPELAEFCENIAERMLTDLLRVYRAKFKREYMSYTKLPTTQADYVDYEIENVRGMLSGFQSNVKSFQFKNVQYNDAEIAFDVLNNKVDCPLTFAQIEALTGIRQKDCAEYANDIRAIQKLPWLEVNKLAGLNQKHKTSELNEIQKARIAQESQNMAFLEPLIVSGLITKERLETLVNKPSRLHSETWLTVHAIGNLQSSKADERLCENIVLPDIYDEKNIAGFLYKRQAIVKSQNLYASKDYNLVRLGAMSGSSRQKELGSPTNFEDAPNSLQIAILTFLFNERKTFLKSRSRKMVDSTDLLEKFNVPNVTVGHIKGGLLVMGVGLNKINRFSWAAKFN